MADEIRTGYTTGKTLTGKVYNAAGTQQGSDVTMTEAGSTGHYSGDFPAIAAGLYDVLILEGSDIVASGSIDWDGTAVITRGSLETKIDTIDTEIGVIDTEIGVIDGLVDDIKAVTDLLPDGGALNDLAAILVDTDELQGNQSNWLTATGFSTAAALQTVDDELATVDNVVDAIKAVTDLLPNAGALTSLATDTDMTTLLGLVTAIKAITDVIPDAGAMTSKSSQSSVDAIKAVTDLLPNAGALTSLATLANQTTLLTNNHTLAQIADAVLTRDVDDMGDISAVSRFTLLTMVLGMNKATRSGNTMTVYDTDGVTVFATITLSTDANAEPVVGVS